MKIKPLAFGALVCVAAIVTGGSAVVCNHVDRATASWRSRWHSTPIRLDGGQITTALVHVLVRAAQ